jgi:hypothetical protein
MYGRTLMSCLCSGQERSRVGRAAYRNDSWGFDVQVSFMLFFSYFNGMDLYCFHAEYCHLKLKISSLD